ncbi:MAG: DUF1801 domain-containing protein [Clostridiales bacterium]|nr:DUF1801 domain-containing protein [Clostridiales bacterium]
MFEEKLGKYSVELRDLFAQLNDLIFAAVPSVNARLWGGLPSYYVKDKFVRLIPSKNHINVEAEALLNYKAQLSDYEFTPKNMLRICVGQVVPADILKAAIVETLSSCC